MQKEIKKVLNEVFGFSGFRKGQEEIVLNLIKKRDVLAIMPTGSGKSLCYYVPAILSEGLTLVVSPLISLMQDQVNFLKSKGVSAQQINSSLTKGMCLKILKDSLKNGCKILYVAPERLLNKTFLEFAKFMKISMVVIDEAHCISKWGHDFRPSYIKMFNFFNLLEKRPVFACFTATATIDVREDILKNMKLKNPFCLVAGFNRSNLFFDVIRMEEKYKIPKLIGLIEKIKNENVIVYCATRANVEKLYKIFIGNGYNAIKYHAGMRLMQRKKNQNYFITGEKNILIATNAFGMGVDKKDIRYIIHFNMPQNIENYYQEVGRAGRDNKPSFCILLFSEYGIKINSFFIEQTKNEELSEDEAKKLKAKNYDGLKVMIDFCMEKGCYRKYILKYFDEEVEFCGNCGNCLRKANRFKFFKKILNILKRGNKNG